MENSIDCWAAVNGTRVRQQAFTKLEKCTVSKREITWRKRCADVDSRY